MKLARLRASDRAGKIPPVSFAESEKFETRAKSRSVAYDRYDVNGFLGERKIHLYCLSYF